MEGSEESSYRVPAEMQFKSSCILSLFSIDPSDSPRSLLQCKH
jgi:hypothetical protein